eukprot:maker-scaffold422_size175911-snap-gene-0.34 protein:Tk09758 transcript:maker-scaffold422_size175911-snap-gene-0.34-mRNA-1 annotation:"trafficking protein particle complex subunit 8"
MSQSRGWSPQGWIQDYFSPVVSVLASPECEALVARNNLTLTELLQPFGQLLSDVTLKDPEGTTHGLASLSVTFQDFKKEPTRLVHQKLMLDLVDDCTEEGGGGGAQPLTAAPHLAVPEATPWFDVWTKLFLHSIPAVEHEYVRHAVGCLFAIAATGAGEPVAQLQALVEEQSRHQRDKPHAYPQMATPQALKYYVLLHDPGQSSAEHAQTILGQMQSAWGAAHCHLLLLNSRPAPPDGRWGPNPALVDYWLTRGPRFCNVDARREGMGATLITTGATVPAGPGPEPPVTRPGPTLDHPLAAPDHADSPSPPQVAASTGPVLNPVNASNLGLRLTSNDIDRIRILIRDKEAPELQMRKLGDFYFMFKLYKPAYSCYHACKKDFQSDEAWNYFAGAAEMCALSQFMQNGSLAKKYPTHYMEDSINKYLQVCQMPEFAVRATLFDAMCLKYHGMYLEAASSYVRLTNETKDLRSSLLLEQAAYCYLLANPPSIRKYAFHIILSGYRFSKSGQKRHSSRAYRQGFQIYQGQDWGLSEDHILYTLGHQSLLLKDYPTASSLFNQLLLIPQNRLNSLQQMCHLREFFIVHHMREKEAKHVASEVTIPKFRPQDCVLDLGSRVMGPGPSSSSSYETLAVMNAKDSWQRLERVFLERIGGQEVVLLSKTCQSLFSPLSYVNILPQSFVGERIRFLVPVSNPFLTTLLLKHVHLLWKFCPDDQSEPVSNERGQGREATDKFVKTQSVDLVTLEKDQPCFLDLEVVVFQPGDLHITGVEYGLKAQFPQSEATDYTIRGKQYFSVRGPRLSTTKEHKTQVVYGKDCRLQVVVKEGQPKLDMTFDLPKTIHQGELRSLELTLRNAGQHAMSNLYFVSQHPGMFSFGSGGKSQTSLFECPVISDSSLTVQNDNGQSVEQPLDFLPIPLKSIQAGESKKLVLWMRGHDNLTLTTIKSHVYYEKAEEKPKKAIPKSKGHYRITTHEWPIKILPSIAVSAERSDVCVFESKQAQSILLHVSNISKDMSRDLDQIKVNHICMVSHSAELDGFHSLHEDRLVARGDSTSLGLKGFTRPTTANKPTSELLFSSMGSGSGDPLCIQKPPYMDFLKPGFRFGATTQAPKLTQDLLAHEAEGAR